MPRKRIRSAEPAQVEVLIAKVVRAVRPGDVVFIETTIPRNKDQLEHIFHQFKKLLPSVKVVVLNAGMRVAEVQTAPAPLAPMAQEEIPRCTN